MTELTTSRLTMRPMRSGDFTAFAALNADPLVMQFFPALLSSSESDQLARRIQARFDANKWGFWAVELTGTAEFIGFVGLNNPDVSLPCAPCTEIGWRLAREHWGYGYATEAAHRALQFAFETLLLAQVVSLTAVGNFRSRAVMERLGMQNTEESFLHPMVPPESGLQEHVLYKIYRSDFT